MPDRRWFVGSIAAIGATALIAGCAGSSSSSSDDTTPPPTVTVTQTKTIVESTTASPGPETTTVGASTATGTTVTTTTGSTAVHALGAECDSADLTPSYLGSNGAAGTIELGFALTNSGSRTCHTYGWPGVEFLSSAGAALPTGATRTTSDMIGTTEPVLINLKPGQAASFRLMGHDAYDGGSECGNAAQLQIFAPDDTVAMLVTINGGAPACGSTGVSPMQPGSSAWLGQ
jgi:hypothetical protein